MYRVVMVIFDYIKASPIRALSRMGVLGEVEMSMGTCSDATPRSDGVCYSVARPR